MKRPGTLGVATNVPQQFPAEVGDRSKGFIFYHVTLHFAKPAPDEIHPGRVLGSRTASHLWILAEESSDGIGFLLSVVMKDVHFRRPLQYLHE
jgi:hypothetical protein